MLFFHRYAGVGRCRGRSMRMLRIAPTLAPGL